MVDFKVVYRINFVKCLLNFITGTRLLKKLFGKVSVDEGFYESSDLGVIYL